ncbi:MULTISPECIES: SMP-30/gluconolactonase/LRE family protein [unclassified Roseitalea]|uniref:SMP-30/gluconolactonase/LRE family protein n=1 Tax=unclassified Roseitalea TaxID=2639107 RepID=UPI00273E2121|nr:MULTISPECIES: SMP-30/gluconolactonase/LRE family protein [unclassified Roseitalea]
MNTHLERLWTGGRWLEGPAWFGGGRYLIFSDIPNDRMMRFDETDGGVSVFREPANNANGNTRDAQGRLVTCEHLGRRVTRTEHDGTVTVIADSHQGRRLNSPNDVVVAADGAIWFTDPTYGIDMDYEGARAESEIGASHLYRVDPGTGAVKAAGTDFVKPNGLAFSADGTELFVADTGATHVDNGPRHIRRFSVDGDRLSGGDVFAECDNGLFDGFRIDVHGNVWTSAGDGVHCYAPDGALLGKIAVPEVVANVCFGGARRNRLFICGTTSLYATYVNVSGLPYPGP